MLGGYEMRVFKVFLNNLKEEEWIKSMAEDGWLIDKIGFRYSFKNVEKKHYNIKMDYRIFKNKDEFEAYVTMYGDFGWKHIAGTKGSGRQYFTNDESDYQSELFSDEASQAARIKRMRKMLRQSLAVALVLFISLLSQNSFSISTLLHPKELYLTPGLWNMAGGEFWSSFLLETPFALFRGILLYAMPLMVLIYIFVSYKIQYEYNNEIGDKSLR